MKNSFLLLLPVLAIFSFSLIFASRIDVRAAGNGACDADIEESGGGWISYVTCQVNGTVAGKGYEVQSPSIVASQLNTQAQQACTMAGGTTWSWDPGNPQGVGSRLANGTFNCPVSEPDQACGLAMAVNPPQPALNSQSGLLEHTVTVTNGTNKSLTGVRVIVKSITPAGDSSVFAYPPSGVDQSGKTYFQHNYSLAPGQSIPILIGYYDPARTGVTVSYSVAAVTPVPEPAIPAGSVLLGPDPLTSTSDPRAITLSNGSKMVEWAQEAGRSYAVQYTDDSSASPTWHTVYGVNSGVAMPTTGANRIQWVDHGSWATKSFPPAERKYRVYQLPTGNYPGPGGGNGVYSTCETPPPPSCNDIGLRMKEAGMPAATVVAAEPTGTVTSPLRISKGNRTYGIILVPPSDPTASTARIKLSNGSIMAIGRCAEGPAITAGNLSFTTDTPVMNWQSTRFEQKVTVTNNLSGPTSAVRATVNSISQEKDGVIIDRTGQYGYRLDNYTGIDSTGKPYMQFNLPLAPGQSVTFTAEIYMITRETPIVSYSVTAVPPAPDSTLPQNAVALALDRGLFLPDGTYLIEWSNTIPSSIFAVQYSDDEGATWRTSSPFGTAGSNRIQWIDNGPPKTQSRPVRAAAGSHPRTYCQTTPIENGCDANPRLYRVWRVP